MRLGLSADELLTTTRSVRRRLDLERPVSASVIEDAIAIAVQAPTGGNLQNWVWIAIQDRDTKRDIAELYRNFYALYREVLRDTPNGGSGSDQQLMSSGDILAANLDRVPWLVIPCISPLGGRVDRETEAFAQAMTWASIFPAVWSLQLALRERGLASCATRRHVLGWRGIGGRVAGGRDVQRRTGITGAGGIGSR
jgi:nitroreductase